MAELREARATVPTRRPTPAVTRREELRTIRGLARSIPEECYDNPTWKGLLYLARDVLFLGLAMAVLLASDSVLLVLAGWLVAAFAIAGLFVIGHDAAHGALFKSTWMNRFFGQLAMLPSLHASSVWAYGHNRVHHAFPACQGFDFVWHPVTPEEYRAMPLWRKLRHRLEWSRVGPGFYYAREIWWNRLMRLQAPEKSTAAFRRDRLWVVAYLLIASVGIGFVGWAQTGTATGVAWAWVKVLLVPWLVWNCLAGWAVYIQHIAPDLRWQTRRRWRKFAGQVETTSNLEMPRWANFFWHNIFVHVPHHVDPRIPFYRLPAAAAALSRGGDGIAGSEPYRFASYRDVTRRCKLYDFEREVWMDYRGLQSSGARESSPLEEP